MHVQAAAKATIANEQLPGLMIQVEKARAEHQRHMAAVQTSQAKVSDLHTSLGSFAVQPAIEHRMLFDCFTFKDPAGVLAMGLTAALNAIAGDCPSQTLSECCTLQHLSDVS